MALTPNRPLNETTVVAQTTSIATTPVAAYAVAPSAGYVQRVLASAGGTTTGTVAVSITINGGSDITAGALTIAAGSNARNNAALELSQVGAGSTSGVFVAEGDFITFTPSGGTGTTIPGAFALVLRKLP